MSASGVCFRHHFLDARGGYDGWGCASLADIAGGGLDFVTGGKGGGFCFWYEFDDGRWTRHVIADDILPQVGGAAVDLDGDSRVEVVCGEWDERGRLWWIRQGADPRVPWEKHVVAKGHSNPHDIVAGDLNGDGRAEIVVRDKDTRLTCYVVPPDAARPWRPCVIAEELPGDGTALLDVDGDGDLDVVTGGLWFENVRGDATEWAAHRFLDPRLDWHPETRVAAGDLEGDGRAHVVVTESEKDSRARMAVFHPPPDPRRGPWEITMVVAGEEDFRALHSLALADFDGDGWLEIFTAEMENGKTDGTARRPRWYLFKRSAGEWRGRVILDANLGTHEARVGDVRGVGRVDIVGKTWRPNAVNGNSGRGHVDWLENCLAAGSAETR